MHECFLVIKAGPDDQGSRPLKGPFASPDVTVGPDGRPRAVVSNLGTRDVEGVVTEFAAIPARMPVRPEHRKIIGYGNPANIRAGGSVEVTCTSIWPRMSTADVLLVTAFHPDLDPVQQPYDPLRDRRVGQMNYAWAGRYQGRFDAQGGIKLAMEIRPANRGLFRVKLFMEVEGRMPSHPQVDRVMAPNGHTFRWLENPAGRKELYDLFIQDNDRMSIQLKTTFLDEPDRADEIIQGMLERA